MCYYMCLILCSLCICVLYVNKTAAIVIFDVIYLYIYDPYKIRKIITSGHDA
jgi:hypothetical protein